MVLSGLIRASTSLKNMDANTSPLSTEAILQKVRTILNDLVRELSGRRDFGKITSFDASDLIECLQAFERMYGECQVMQSAMVTAIVNLGEFPPGSLKREACVQAILEAAIRQVSSYPPLP